MRDQGLGSWRFVGAACHSIAFVHGATCRTYARARRPPPPPGGCTARPRRGERGDRVAYLSPNDPTLLETLFAATALGGVFVPLNWQLTAPELTYIAADCGATVLVHAAA